MLVTEHLKHFPSKPLAAFGLDARITDDFFRGHDHAGRRARGPAIGRMRERLLEPTLMADELLRRMEAGGLTEMLRLHIESL